MALSAQAEMTAYRHYLNPALGSSRFGFRCAWEF